MVSSMDKSLIDIESCDLHDYQKHLYSVMTKPYKGKGTIQVTGRNTGKSIVTAQAIQRLMEDLMNRPVEELICQEGKVAGARYYTVEPVGGNWKDMETWCTQTFGEPAEVWDIGKSDYIWPELGRWYINNRRFWFRDLKDRDWFVIRWNA